MTFVGLKRMQTTENWLKLAEYSKSALESGDVDEAVRDALARSSRGERNSDTGMAAGIPAGACECAGSV